MNIVLIVVTLLLIATALLWRIGTVAHKNKIIIMIMVLLALIALIYAVKNPHTIAQFSQKNQQNLNLASQEHQLVAALKATPKQERALFCSSILARAWQQRDFQKSDALLLTARQCYSGIGAANVAAALVEAQITRFDNPQDQNLYHQWLYQRVYLLLQMQGIDSPEFQSQLANLLARAPNLIDALWLQVALEFYRGNQQASLKLIERLQILINQLPEPERQLRAQKLADFKKSIEHVKP